MAGGNNANMEEILCLQRNGQRGQMRQQYRRFGQNIAIFHQQQLQ